MMGFTEGVIVDDQYKVCFYAKKNQKFILQKIFFIIKKNL